MVIITLSARWSYFGYNKKWFHIQIMKYRIKNMFIRSSRSPRKMAKWPLPRSGSPSLKPPLQNNTEDFWIEEAFLKKNWLLSIDVSTLLWNKSNENVVNLFPSLPFTQKVVDEHTENICGWPKDTHTKYCTIHHLFLKSSHHLLFCCLLFATEIAEIDLSMPRKVYRDNEEKNKIHQVSLVT